MAVSYLTQAQKESIGSIIDNVHTTFAREIVIFKIGQRVAISNDSSYNAFYASQSEPERETVSLTTKARIKYVKAEESLFSIKDGSLASGNQDKIVLPAGSIKIKVDQEAKNFISGAQRIEVDGNRYSVVSNGRLIAMFGPSISPYYEFILVPTDE